MFTIINLSNLFFKILFSNFVENGPSESEKINNKKVNKESNNYENLSPEDKELLEQIQDLQKMLEGVQATKTYTKKAGEHLQTALRNDPSTHNDPEAEHTKKMLETYIKEFKDATVDGKVLEEKLVELKQNVSKLGDKVEYDMGIDNSGEGDTYENVSLSKEELKTITNKEFLGLPEEKRLQYVTMENVDYENIANGNVKEVTFNFDNDGNGRDDTDLYRLTTAGQVSGKEVGAVESGGITYTRGGLDGEFFNGNDRLVIHTNTKVEISELRSVDDIAVLEAGITDKLNQLPEELLDGNIDIAREALERGLDPELAINNFSEIIDARKGEKREIVIEELFTQVDRIRDMFDLSLDDEKLFDYLVDTNKDGHIDSFNEFEAKFEITGDYPPGKERYLHVANEVSSRYPRISNEKLITLIDHENINWDPNIKAPGSSAYGLGQMINSTWLEYGKGLDRSNPRDQLEATCRYLDAIMNRKDCPMELAMAYYNTGEAIHSISTAKAKDYANKNPAIAEYIKGPVTPDSYFNAAVKYYNTKIG